MYVDAEEMEKVFEGAWDKVVVGSGLPGAPMASGSSSGPYGSALTPLEEEETTTVRGVGVLAKTAKHGRKQVISDDEYLTPSDEE